MISKFTLFILSIFLIGEIELVAQPTAFTACPDETVGVVRSGGAGGTTNAFSVYTVNSATGAATTLAGPILDPASATTNLQINGVGLDITDGYLYGLFSDAPATLSFAPTTPFYRLGANGIAQQLGVISGPVPTGSDNGSFVIPNAGEFDQSGNYYFSATTGLVALNIFNLQLSTFTPSTFYIGKLSAVSAMTGGTAALAPTYVAITNPSNDAAAYLTASSATITATSAQRLGLQDLIYNSADGLLYTYVSWDNGNNGYFGQMLRVDPNTGIMTALAAPVTQPFITASVYPNGMLIDKNGNFLVLFTNGAIYKATGTPSAYTGALSLLTGSSGFPTSLIGDMASCGLIANPLPHPTLHFDAWRTEQKVNLQWQNTNEQAGLNYELEFSTDGTTFETVYSAAQAPGSMYAFVHDNIYTSVTYYRLKVTDKDGGIQYSFIKGVDGLQSEILIYPNPVRDELTIRVSDNLVEKNLTIKIMNQYGQVITDVERKSTTGFLSLNLSKMKLASGIYFLSLSHEGSSEHVVHSFELIN